MTSRPTVLDVRDLSIVFNGVRALSSVTLSLMDGERRAIIGPNGAGKTTLFNAIEGRVPLATGGIYFMGEDITSLSTHHRARRGLARTFQITNLFPGLEVEANVSLAVAGASRRLRRTFWRRLSGLQGVQASVKDLLEEWELWSVRHRRVQELSYGQQRVLEIAVALCSGARLLLLDEPTAGLSRREAEILTTAVQTLPTGLTVLLIEHDMEVAFAVAHAVTVLVNGEVIAEGSPGEVRNDPAVIEAYLGASTNAKPGTP